MLLLRGEAIKEYALSLINDIPHDCYVMVLVVFCAGTVMAIGLKGWKNGFRYSMGLLLVEYIFLIYTSTVVFREILPCRKYDITPFWSYRAIMDGREPQLLSENIMNVAVFVPVGLLAGAAFKSMSWWKVLVMGLILSVGIETMQFVFKKGFSEVDDVIHNTMGCLIGYGLFQCCRLAIKRGWSLQKKY